MSRTEVRFINGPDGRPLFQLEHAPFAGNVRRKALPFPAVDAQNALAALAAVPLEDNAVRTAGGCLRDALGQHPDIQAALVAAFGAAQGKSLPLYFAIDSPEANALPWETLFDPGAGFVALDSRWPIARATDPITSTRSDERLLEFPLRFAFVLSASGRDALPEWRSIHRALEDSPVEFEAQLFTSQDHVTQAIAQAADARFTARPIGGKANLLDALGEYAPQFMHFFCHGSDDFSPHLLIATATDQQLAPPGPGFALEAKELLQLEEAMKHLWVVTLNACLGASPPEIGLSLAQSLADAGPPAVIGMREIVATEDAHEFSRAFYNAVVDHLAAWRDAPVQPVEVHWASVVRAARAGILAKHEQGRPAAAAAANCKEWTLPVTYVRREPFVLRRVQGGALSAEQRAELTAELEVLQSHRENASAVGGTPASVLAAIDARIAEIRPQLGI